MASFTLTTTAKKRLQELTSRQAMMEFARTMVWVAPLTILIWVYAEREQIATVTDVSFPMQVHSGNPGRIASLPVSGQGQVTVELEGPRVKLDALRQQLATGLPPGGMVVEIDANAPLGPVNRRTVDLLNDEVPLFRNAGVKVTSATPPQVTVSVDELVTRELVVVPAPVAPTSGANDGGPNFDQPPVFDPPTARVSGPKWLVERLLGEQASDAVEGGRATIRAELSQGQGGALLRVPGMHELSDVPLLRPKPASNDDASMAAMSQLTVTPERVRASVKIRQADVSFTIPAMPIFVIAPTSFLDDYRATGYEPVITNVTVQGPPDLIAALRNDMLEQKPKALLELTRDDLPPGRTITRKLRFDLPDGLTISAEEANREIEFTLAPRTKG